MTEQSEAAPFLWTMQTEQAAALMAEGKVPDARIATRLKVDRSTLWRWKQHPEFRERVQSLIAAFRQAIREQGIAVLENRVERLNADWNSMQALRDARAKDARDTRVANDKAVAAHIEGSRKCGASDKQIEDQLRDVRRGLPRVAPGMETGLIVRGYKVTGGMTFEEFTFDAPLLKEMRAHEEQAAKELGQWTEKQDVTSGGKPVTLLGLNTISDNDLDQRIADALSASTE